jgi:hypothetical protein
MPDIWLYKCITVLLYLRRSACFIQLCFTFACCSFIFFSCWRRKKDGVNSDKIHEMNGLDWNFWYWKLTNLLTLSLYIFFLILELILDYLQQRLGTNIIYIIYFWWQLCGYCRFSILNKVSPATLISILQLQVNIFM